MTRVNNTKGRLLREPNAIDGTIPGFTGQFFDNEGYAHEVRPDDPYPTGDYGMTEGGVWIPKKVSDDGTTLTQLTGSIVEELADYEVDAGNIGFNWNDTKTYLNADGTLDWSNNKKVYDVSGYKGCVLIIRNNFDVTIESISVLYYLNGNRGVSRDYSMDVTKYTETVPPDGEFLWYSKDDENKFKYYGGFAIYIGFKDAESQPTEGSVAWEMAGVR